MNQAESKLTVIDNTGAKKVKFIRALGQIRSTGTVGDMCVGSVVSRNPNTSFPSVVYFVIVRTKYPVRRPDGSYVSFGDNACVLVKKEDGSPLGTCITGPIAIHELRKRTDKYSGYSKIISLTKGGV